MVGDAVLRVVVGADFFAAVAGADLAATQRRFGFLALATLVRGELGAQHVHGARAVLQLRAFLAARHDDAARLVRDADRRLGLVDVLAAGARGFERVDLEVGRADLDLTVVFDFRKHRDGRGRGVNPAGGFGRRDALHAVDARLVLEPAVRFAALDRDDDFLVAAGFVFALAEQLDAHLHALGEARVHAQQVAREDSGFVAARAGANLDEDVLRVVGIARQHQLLELRFEHDAPLAQRRRFFFRERGDLGIALVGAQRVVLDDLAQQRFVRAIRRDGRLDR